MGLVRLFLLGSFIIGLYMSANGFYRFAATDGAPEAYRPRAISYVMGAGLASAIVGPQLVGFTADALAPVPFAGAYVAAAALNVLGVRLFALSTAPARARRRPRPAHPFPPRVLRSPRIAVAMVCAMVSYALMNLVMTSTPLAIVGCASRPPTPPTSSPATSSRCSPPPSSPAR